MPGIDRILFPVDFSERCAQTAQMVAAWARQFQAKVTLLHAISLTRGIDDPGLYEAFQPAIQQAAEVGLAAFAQQHFGSLAVTRVVEMGGASERTIARAEKERTSLIMMPTHGHGAFRRFLTGSATAQVLHDAQCPVWTSAHTASQRAKRPEQMRTILCAVDLDATAVSLIRWATWLASSYDARLKVVHVMPAVDETSKNRGEKAVRRYWTQQAEAAMSKIMRQAGQPKDELVLRGGHIATMLAATAAEQKADLLVIGRGHLKKSLGRLRTHTMPIICKSPCPVLSV